MKKLTAVILLLVACVTMSPRMSAQEETYKFDLGVQLGMDGYLGDVNEGNIFSKPGFAAGVSFRYLADARWAIRGVFNSYSLSGDSSKFDNVFPGGENYSFKSTAYDLGARIEFNFFAYGIGETYKRLRRWSPYLAVGIGMTYSTCDGQNAFAPNIPMAFGVKYKLKERWNLGVEFSMTKVFGDKVDGELSDLYQIKSSFLKNTDWYSNLSVSITYEFGKRCVTCHYVD